jgi:hypothetical protein
LKEIYKKLRPKAFWKHLRYLKKGKIIIIIVVIIIIVISFMLGIDTYFPETNYVPREYSIVAVLFLILTVPISLVPYYYYYYYYYYAFLKIFGFSVSAGQIEKNAENSDAG